MWIKSARSLAEVSVHQTAKRSDVCRFMERMYTNGELKLGSELSGSSMYQLKHGPNEALSQTRELLKKG